MVQVKDVYEQNQNERESFFIHLCKEKKDEFDSLIDVLWEGWLKNIPVEYMENEVKSIGQSLADLEKGITGFYLELKNFQNQPLVEE